MIDKILVCCETDAKAVPYLAALKSAGVRAEDIVVVTPDTRPSDATGAAAQAAGVVLCGGPDYEPWRFGESAREDANLELNPPLDALDHEVFEGARRGTTPVWAICRGMQGANVFLGGTLWQDLPTQRPDTTSHDVPEPREALAHAIEMTGTGDRLAEILGRGPTEVNSRHHQAVKDLGRGLRELARSPDGVIEVVVLDSADWWVKGVQWHPENLIHLEVQRQLWLEFVQASETKKTRNRNRTRRG